LVVVRARKEAPNSFRPKFFPLMSSRRARPESLPQYAPLGVPVQGFCGVSSRAYRARSIEATGMRLEVRRSRSLRSSNLFPLASYIPSDQEPGRTASELRTALFSLFQGRVHALGRSTRDGSSRAFSSCQTLDPNPETRFASAREIA